MLRTMFFVFLCGVFADCDCRSGGHRRNKRPASPGLSIKSQLGPSSPGDHPLAAIGCVTLDRNLPLPWLERWSLSQRYDSELLRVNYIQYPAGSKVGVAKLSCAFASLALVLADTQSEDSRYIAQVTTPQTCLADYSGNFDVNCSFGANLVDCRGQPLQIAVADRFCQPDALDQPVGRVRQRYCFCQLDAELAHCFFESLTTSPTCTPTLLLTSSVSSRARQPPLPSLRRAPMSVTPSQAATPSSSLASASESPSLSPSPISPSL
eukprot:g77703.t1